MKCYFVDANGLEGCYDDALELLSESRKVKALSYVFEKDRYLSITAGLFFRYVEMRYRTDIHIGKNDKPYCEDESVHFNISHSGHYVAFAESKVPIGIDIEEIGEHSDIYRNVMAEDEYRNFIGYPKEEHDDLFCRMWTVKESYMKAVGSGLTIAPNSFSVIEKNGIRYKGFPGGLIVHELDAPKGYHASVCSKEGRTAKAEMITVDGLINIIS